MPRKKKDDDVVVIKKIEPVKTKRSPSVHLDPNSNPEEDGVLGEIVKSIKSYNQHEVQRLAFEIDPQDQETNAFAGMYRQKNHLVPDDIIKKITGPMGDDLVCQIIQARSNHIASFGRPRPDRFSTGFQFDPLRKDIVERDDYEDLKDRIERAKDVLWNCGYKGLNEEWSPNLSQFNKMITRDGIRFGRMAVEFVYVKDAETGERKFHSFRPVDAGTIYRIIPRRRQDQSVRKEAVALIEQLKDVKIDKSKLEKDEYKYVQVVNGKPIQAFTEEELIVYNVYPATDVEYNGYPLTPIDQSLNAIITHINITLHNKLYFKNGRAARGMVVIKSDDVDEAAVHAIRNQFTQSINSVRNSWRMPVFGVGSEDDVSWQSIDISGRDAEFQYLSDQNARSILSAFQMSPEELPGYSHLARGTNTQALSESNNEYKLTAARDVGLRPLILDIQDFYNTHVIPKIDKELSKLFQLTLAGLDKEDPEKESTRISQDMALHMTYNEILERVEKETIPPEAGGKMPLNQQWLQQVAPFLTVGQILQYFFGVEGATKDPRFNYIRDDYWFQYQQLQIQKAQMAMQQMMMQQQQEMEMMQQNGQLPPPPAEEQAPPGATEEEAAQVQQQNMAKREQWFKDCTEALVKANKDNHNYTSKMILRRHRNLVEKQMGEFAKDSKNAVNQILQKVNKNGNK